MTIFDILKGLKEADDNTQSIQSQAISDYSPYIKSAQATDRLGYGKIVLIDFCQYTFLYISPSIFIITKQGVNEACIICLHKEVFIEKSKCKTEDSIRA